MNPGIDPFDELAALFLTEPDPPLRGQGASGTATTELLLVGHLPVRAGVWLAPYADALARAAGPTALLRLDDSAPHLQLLRGSDLSEDPMTLQQTIESLQHDVRLWVIRPPSDVPTRRLVEAGLKRITVLTGADEAALVSAYQTIKQLAAAAEDAGLVLPPMGIAVMGSDESTARSAVKRLNQTTHSFLGVELSLIQCLPRMDAGMISSGYKRFPGERCPELTDVLEWIGREAPAAAPAAVRRSVSAQAPPVPVAPPAHHATRDEEPIDLPPVVETIRGAGSQTPETRAVRPEIREPAAAHPEPAPPATARLAPKAYAEVEPKHPAPQREPDEGGRPVDLARHVDGLEPLPVRCPGCEDVELAVDQDGRVHLLGRETTLRRLPVVRRWAFEHRELIAMACPRHRIDLREPPCTHVFTPTPLAVSDLHASDLQLHVLAPVQVGGAVGWYSARLNQG